MSLSRYAAKRNFTRSPEPRGRRAARKGWSFVVQKHAARRLHYDLRLELGGVLKSWAVTRGPSLVPNDRRLAVEVEDHPLAYGGFEGAIPKGEYGGGRVLVWDNGDWESEGDPRAALRKGHLRFTLHGKKLQGRFDLVRMHRKPGDKHDNWLLIKVQDAFARTSSDPDILVDEPRSVTTGRTIDEIEEPEAGDPPPARAKAAKRAQAPSAVSAKRAPPGKETARPAKAESTTASRRKPRSAALDQRPARKHAEPQARTRPDAWPGAVRGSLPGFVELALATPSAKAPSGTGFIHEIKLDGYRLQARLDHGRVTLRTRTGLDWTSKFSTLAAALREIKADQAILDGEVVAEMEQGVSRFSELQDQLKEGRGDKLIYYVFDLLHLDGYDLTRVPLSRRKMALAEIVPAGARGFVRLSETFQADGETLKKHACRIGLEGIVSKRAESRYRPGRSGDWLKVKCGNRQELVVVGYALSTTARRAIGSLALAVNEDGRLKFAGKVGSGFSTGMSEDLWRELEPLRRDKPSAEAPPDADIRNVRWVEPRLVAEVEFREWTASGLIRQSVFHGLRYDKDPKDVVRERPMPSPETKPRGHAKTAAAKGGDARARLTHPDRLYWSDAGISKQGLADYYTDVWPWIEPHIARRPLALVRCPGGAEEQCFFQKHAWAGLDRALVHPTRIGGEEVLSIDTLAGLHALVQAGSLEIHPWGSTLDNPEHPDRLIFDLDPGESVPWEEVERAALLLRARLHDQGLASFVKTTGGKGLHVVVPVSPVTPWEAAKAFTQSVAAAMVAEARDRYVAKMSKAVRAGKIFIDYLRNGRGATAVAAYSTRARPGAPVSTPLAWEELGSGLSPAHFTVTNLRRRLRALDRDPWADMAHLRQSIPKRRR